MLQIGTLTLDVEKKINIIILYLKQIMKVQQKYKAQEAVQEEMPFPGDYHCN
jgi:hypothetical protein